MLAYIIYIVVNDSTVRFTLIKGLSKWWFTGITEVPSG